MANEPSSMSVDFDGDEPSGASALVGDRTYKFTREGSWPRMIPVSERLPNDCDEMLIRIVFDDDGFEDWGLGAYMNGRWVIFGQCTQEFEGHEDESRTVTHYLPLPPHA